MVNIKNGKPNGKGTRTYPDASTFVGEFNDGEMWNGHFLNGNITSKVVNGELQ